MPYKIIRSGAEVTSIEFMDNKSIKLTGAFIKTELPYVNDNGCYVIVTIETFDEAELEKKMEIVNDLCLNAGAVEMLEADENRIWKARRNYAEAARDASLMYYAEDFVVSLDHVIDVMNLLPGLEKKHGIPTMTVAHIGDSNIHTDLMKYDIPDEE